MPSSRRDFLLCLGKTFAIAPVLMSISSSEPIQTPTGQLMSDVDFQSGDTITIHPAASELSVGDIVVMTDVYAVRKFQRVDKSLRQFVVTRKLNYGDRILCFYPPVIDSSDSRYQTTESLVMRGTKIIPTNFGVPV